jgi:hypothetical protein
MYELLLVSRENQLKEPKKKKLKLKDIFVMKSYPKKLKAFKLRK